MGGKATRLGALRGLGLALCLLFGLPSAQAESGLSSLASLSEQVAKIPIDEPTLVVIGPLQETNEGGPRFSKKARAGLHDALLRIVGSAIGQARLRESAPLSLAQATVRAKRANLPLVHLQPSMEGGQLQLEMLFIKWPRSFWQRALNPGGTVMESHTFRVPADTTIRRSLPPARGLFTEQKTYKNPISSPLAMACGDIDGDGGSELLVVGRNQVALGRFSNKKFLIEARANTSDLSPLSATPLRAPLGGAQLTRDGVLIGLSDRKDAIIVDHRLQILKRLSPRFPLSSSRCVAFTETGLDTREHDCDAPTLLPSESPALDAFAVGFNTEEDGTVTEITSQTRNGSTEALVVVKRVGSTERVLTLKDSGHVLSWADLDGDGTAELLVSRGTSIAQDDALNLLTLTQNGLVKIGTRVGGPVHAVAVCPFFGENPLVVVAAVGEDLWVFL